MTREQIGEDAEKEQHGGKPPKLTVNIPLTIGVAQLFTLLGGFIGAAVWFDDFGDGVLQRLDRVEGAVEAQSMTLQTLGSDRFRIADFEGWLVRFDDAVKLWTREVESVLGSGVNLPEFHAPDAFPRRR